MIIKKLVEKINLDPIEIKGLLVELEKKLFTKPEELVTEIDREIHALNEEMLSNGLCSECGYLLEPYTIDRGNFTSVCCICETKFKID